MPRTKKALLGAITGSSQIVAFLILQVTIAPLILKYAGQLVLGTYAILMQILGFTSLLDLGLNAATKRFLSQSFNQKDESKKFNNILTVIKSFTFLTSLISAALIIMVGCLGVSFLNIPDNIKNDFQYCCYIISLWIIIKVPILFYSNALISIQKIAFTNIIQLLSQAVRLLLSVLFVMNGYGLIGIVVANIIGEVIFNLICKWKFLKIFNLGKLNISLKRSPLFLEMFTFGKQVQLMNISNKLISGTDSIVSGILFGAATTSIYYTTQTPANVITQLVLKISDSIFPAINELYAKNKVERIREIFIDGVKYNFILAFTSFLFIFLVTKFAITIWVGENQFGGYSLSLALATYSFFLCYSHLFNQYNLALGQIKFISKISFCEGVTNVILSVILAKEFGIAGIMWATAITHVPTFIISLTTIFKSLKISITGTCFTLVKIYVYPALVSLIILLIVFFLSHRLNISMSLETTGIILGIITFIVTSIIVLSSDFQILIKHLLRPNK